MNNDLDELISKMNEDLENVHKTLQKARFKESSNSKTKQEALMYIEKAEKVIEQAESGKINLSDEQVDRIKETLQKILQLFRYT